MMMVEEWAKSQQKQDVICSNNCKMKTLEYIFCPHHKFLNSMRSAGCENSSMIKRAPLLR